jgi:hypothetical protein
MNIYTVSTKIIHAEGKNTVKKRNESCPIHCWVGNMNFSEERNKNMAEQWKIMQVYTPSMQRRYEIVGR